MLGLIFKRLLLGIPTVLAVTAVLFIGVIWLQGSPATLMLGDTASPQAIAALNAKYGFDKPLGLQYINWLGAALQGDMGRSFATQQSVSSVVRSALPVTLELSLWAVGLAALSAVVLNTVPIGQRVLSPLITFVSIIGITIPNFMLGVSLIYVFSMILGWLPSTGWVPWSDGVVLHLKHLVMPVVTLAAYYFGVFSITYRSQYAAADRSLFAQVARAKGVSESGVAFKHALPNAISPLIIFIGISMGQLVGGAVVTETVFSMPGMGRLFVNAIGAKDFPVMLAIGIIIIVGVVLTNLVADIVHAIVDPRIRPK